jgi:hypothetical protein
LKSGIVDLLCSGVNELCVEMKSNWLALVHSLVALYTPSTKAIHQVVDSGVTEALLDSMGDEDEDILERWVHPILLKTRNYFVQKTETRITLLEDKRSHLSIELFNNKLERLKKKRALLVETNEYTR